MLPHPFIGKVRKAKNNSNFLRLNLQDLTVSLSNDVSLYRPSQAHEVRFLDYSTFPNIYPDSDIQKTSQLQFYDCYHSLYIYLFIHSLYDSLPSLVWSAFVVWPRSLLHIVDSLEGVSLPMSGVLCFFFSRLLSVSSVPQDSKRDRPCLLCLPLPTCC